MSAVATARRSIRDRGVLVGRAGWVTIRPIQPSDADGLLAFYAGLSADASFTRFLSLCRGIGDDAARHYAGVDHLSGDGLVAVLREAGAADDAIVGHACMEPDGDGVEEIAFAVADRFRGHGIGTMLMDAAVASARRRSVRRLTATLFAVNAPMRRLLVHAGPHVVPYPMDAGIEQVDLDLSA